MKKNIEKDTFGSSTPVRTKPLPKAYLGTKVMGDEELQLLEEVVKNQLPFRNYGDGVPHMVNDFEAPVMVFVFEC